MADFDFRLGRQRQLRGSGWKGLLALFMLLAAVILLAAIGVHALPSIAGGLLFLGRAIRLLIGG